MWQIIGAGAIGCLWAANLQGSGAAVHLVSRTPLLSHTLYYQDLQQQRQQFNISCSTQLIKSDGPILVCVKATQVMQAIQERMHIIGPQQPIILMHNGMGCAEQVQKLLPHNPIICATTANASLLHGPLNISQTGLGITYLGPFNSAASAHKNLQQPLNLALKNCHWCDSIKPKLLLKLLINMAINPLTAIHQIKNGELLEAQFEQQIKAISREGEQIAHAENICFAEDELYNMIMHVITQTAQNYSSMNRDIHFQRTTENEYIAGYLLKKAAQHKINIPTIASLYEQVEHVQAAF